MSGRTEDRCKFSTYGYACSKPVEHGRYLCEEHATAKCSSCGQPATHGCDFCGQFVCGAPLCDECTYGTDETKSSGAWGFMNHIHVSKPEFALKHSHARLLAALTETANAIGEWSRPTGANGMTTPRNNHPLLLALSNANAAIARAEGRRP
ncbi:hypothetical protein ACFFTN_01155 [Aminobacter aganoensis]|uniref:Uncharacterized protein n=1 Tax=Aminobacter aganoensis TaxID=83264 RepID=A0A7X0KJZ6_9HYPH|nr:hypothetical protein [Aminobacter aganoensis]MBB6353536.1 hypothetical protein [Aminobacter aganoensis]